MGVDWSGLERDGRDRIGRDWTGLDGKGRERKGTAPMNNEALEPLAPRQLLDAHLEQSYGLTWLVITVPRLFHVRKDGTAVARPHTTRYLVERGEPGVVRLVTDRTAAEGGPPLAYTVRREACSCK